MPNPNGILARSIQLEPPLDRSPEELLRELGSITVVLDGERRLSLNVADPRAAGFARVLDGFHSARLPVYVEVDPEDDTITRILMPLTVRVVEIRPQADMFEVFAEPSQARHVLRRGNPDAAELERILTESRVAARPILLIEDDTHDILDVREFILGPDDGPLPPLPPLPRPEPLQRVWWPIALIRRLAAWIRRWICWFRCWWGCWWRCPSEARAQEVFDTLAATTCNPSSVPPPCIPFRYPDDGCWARAHEMCRLMIAMGLSPRKVWIDSGPASWLSVATRNHPNCSVNWGWHVAPTLCVRGPSFWQTRRMVIDPSLFTTPVTQATWKGLQGDPTAALTDTSADQFWHGGGTDPTYVASNSILAQYRLALLNRSVQFGPPPYANCP